MVVNEIGIYIYNIEWNDKVKDYFNVLFGVSNLLGSGYYVLEILKDILYIVIIKIDGCIVFEYIYIRKG